MNPIIYVIPVFLATILLEVAIAHYKGRKLYNLPDAITSMHIGMLSQLIGVFTKLANIGLYIVVHQQFSTGSWSLESPLLWVIALVMYDFFYYWKHRMGHEVSVLWAAHIAHHSSEYFNLSTALRQSSTGALFSWMFYIPMAVVGVPPKMFITVALIDLLYQYWVHTELIGKLGWMEKIFVTPSNHRVHHGQNDYCIDVNYGGIFIIWDRLFGTYADERDDEKVCFGVRKPLNSLNPVWANLHYYVELWQRSRQAHGLRAKMDVWFGPPGGWTDQPLNHFEPLAFKRFDVPTPKPLLRYAVAHYVVLFAVLAHFLAVFPVMSAAQAGLYALWVVCGLTALCLMMQGKRLGRWLELARLLVAATSVAVQPQWFGSELAAPLQIAIAAAALASLVWVSLQRMNFSGQQVVTA